MATHSTKSEEVEKKWVLIDASGLVVGRLASIIALRLRGKHKPSYTPHVDDGDNVIVVNAASVSRRFTSTTPVSSAASKSAPRVRSWKASSPSASSKRRCCG